MNFTKKNLHVEKKKIGLLFGSFNPVHVGHLIIAETMSDLVHIKEVWLVVSPHNPLKDKRNLLNQHDRLHLVRLAVQDNPHLRASSIEFGLPRPSYTIDTLAHLYEQYPDHDFELIMGEDNLAHFHKWKNYEQILKYHRLLVYPRPGCQTPDHYRQHPQITWVNAPLLDISATYIRERLKNRCSIRYLVPNEVAEYIASTGWWRTNKASSEAQNIGK